MILAEGARQEENVLLGVGVSDVGMIGDDEPLGSNLQSFNDEDLKSPVDQVLGVVVMRENDVQEQSSRSCTSSAGPSSCSSRFPMSQVSHYSSPPLSFSSEVLLRPQSFHLTPLDLPQA